MRGCVLFECENPCPSFALAADSSFCSPNGRKRKTQGNIKIDQLTPSVLRLHSLLLLAILIPPDTKREPSWCIRQRLTVVLWSIIVTTASDFNASIDSTPLWHPAKVDCVKNCDALWPIIYCFQNNQRLNHGFHQTEPTTLQKASYLSRNISKPYPLSDRSLSTTFLRSIWQSRGDSKWALKPPVPTNTHSDFLDSPKAIPECVEP